MTLPDYVFDTYLDKKSDNPTYQIMSLSETKKFVEANRHLPRVPSRAEIKKDGAVNLQGLIMITLEKVEEAFIHIFDLDAKVMAQQAKIDSLEARLQKLEASIQK
jgi:hypothetical protein